LEVSIGTKLKALRLQAGLTQVQLAQAAGIKQNTLTFYENDKKVPSAPRLAAIANALHTTVEELLDKAPAKPVQDRRIHGNSAVALIQKIAMALGEDAQMELLHQARLIQKAHKLTTYEPGPKRPRKAA
jgi:transcriptional regulator with XRE-family HTH domain